MTEILLLRRLGRGRKAGQVIDVELTEAWESHIAAGNAKLLVDLPGPELQDDEDVEISAPRIPFVPVPLPPVHPAFGQDDDAWPEDELLDLDDEDDEHEHDDELDEDEDPED